MSWQSDIHVYLATWGVRVDIHLKKTAFHCIKTDDIINKVTNSSKISTKEVRTSVLIN